MPADPNARTSYKIQVDTTKPPRFVSLRWRVLAPILLVLMVALMLSAYGLAYAVTADENTTSEPDVLASRERIAKEALSMGQKMRTEVDRIAFTQDVPLYIRVADGGALQNVIEPLAALAELDLVVVGNPEGGEIIGLQRVVNSGKVDYAITSQAELTSIQAVQSVMGGASSASNIVMVERRPMLVMVGPVKEGETLVGVVMVGLDITRVLNTLQGDTKLTLFGGSSVFLGSTLDSPPTMLGQAAFDAALNNGTEVSVENIVLKGKSYQTTAMPFIVNEAPIGVLAIYQPEANVEESNFTQQIASLLAAAIVGAVCVAGYFSVTWQIWRINKITHVADKLASGEEIRTNMTTRDEVSAMGVALDRYAAAAKLQVQQLQNDLRQERRQVAHLQAILDGLPHGILIQDVDGRVMTMNGAARDLLGVYGDSKEAQQLKSWAAQVSNKLGQEIAPGIFTIDETTQMRINHKMLHVQAASLVTMADKLMGTVLVLRDVTDKSVSGTRHKAMLNELAQDAHVSASLRVQMADTNLHSTGVPDTMDDLAREIAQDSRAMQRMISEYHDLTLLRKNELREQAINVGDLMLALVDDWRSLALAAGIDLEISLPEDDVYVLGDEKRLRMALGNLIDNSLKYAAPGAQVFVQAYPIVEESHLEFLVEDTGVGISPDELPHVFTRFYRGRPFLPDGSRLKVPGSGQGLFLARQIIAAHGGQISLTSKPGAGTQVSILLPLTAEVSLVIEPEMESQKVSLWDQPTTKMRLAKHQ